MAATIRLQRVGRNKQASFRIVVSDFAESRSGPAIATLGTYNPRTKPSAVRVDAGAALYWLRVGARPTDTVRSIFKKTGVWEKFRKGVTPEELEEKIVTAGAPPGRQKTSARAAAAETARATAEERAAAEPEATPEAAVPEAAAGAAEEESDVTEEAGEADKE
ncbi:MAG: 30S ribosomal protein S16 [Gemmatimonadota bacterium]